MEEENLKADYHPARPYVMIGLLCLLCFIIGMGFGKSMQDDGCIPYGSAWDRYGR